MDVSATDCLIPLDADWQLVRASADSIANPTELLSQVLPWQAACVPGTVAQVMLKNSAHTHPQSLTDDDWWYRCHFTAEAVDQAMPVLYFAGLATIAQVWLNGVLILESRNMFLPQQVVVTECLQATNELVICFRSLAQVLRQKRPRPRWKTNLVSQQPLRWVRTTLLGHIPGWCPPVTPVGPWRSITLMYRSSVELVKSHIQHILTAEGEFTAEFDVQLPPSQRMSAGHLYVGNQTLSLQIKQNGAVVALTGQGIIDAAQRWWPHTHGQPKRLGCRLEITVAGQVYTWELGARGFKQQRWLSSDNQLALQVNGETLFCRGACWTVADIFTLDGSEDSLRRSLCLARDAGINMLRIGGTMIYESDSFYRLCDELGILVWQDFMFANMDYPVEDADFHQQALAEAHAQVARLSRFVCVSVYCGNSEVQQQSAMMGMPREYWSNVFFDAELAEVCQQRHPGVMYFPSTPCGGALPFTISEGLAHYYGVGAYKRALNDAALAPVKFTPETLGFSHIPEPETVDKIFNGALFAAHHPDWKARVPRDSSAGWDFEDIRDYYLALLFQVDAVALRSHDPQRYLELSRVVTGEIIQRVFAIWRSAEHPCQGALLWFYKDLLPGAGWGILDSDNQPKAVYYAFKRAAKTLAVYCIDRGLDGLSLTLVNETELAQAVTLEVTAYKSGHIETLKAARALTLSPRSTIGISADELLGYFADLTYSYRFGPRQHDLVSARLLDAQGQWLHEDFYFPTSYAVTSQKIDGITVEVIALADGRAAIKIFTPMFLQSVRVECKTHRAEDNYFHLAPNATRVIAMEPLADAAVPVKGYLEALNLLEPIKVR
jgi:beta-mannosidase